MFSRASVRRSHSICERTVGDGSVANRTRGWLRFLRFGKAFEVIRIDEPAPFSLEASYLSQKDSAQGLIVGRADPDCRLCQGYLVRLHSLLHSRF